MDKQIIDNNFRYHAPVGAQEAVYDAIRGVAKTLADFINEVCPESREKSLAFTNLEQSVMWANASIARSGKSEFEPVEEPPDRETLIDNCYWCGRNFDTGVTSAEALDEKPYCGSCNQGPDSE